jgi:DNA-binding CsgD family transcriptional regulator
MASALLGLVADARADLARSTAASGRASAHGNEATALFGLGLLELSLGDHAAAAHVYAANREGDWSHESFFVGGRGIVDAVEAFAAVGDLESAAVAVAALPPDARERPVVEALLAAADGDLAGAVALLRSARQTAIPFRRARELLLLGRLLRQSRQRGEAREVLTAALEQFRALEAPLWAARAEEDLARLGGRARSDGELTASERRVVELVASGLANKEVAARLFVTRRTVEAHLSSAYAKLGVRSRSELAARWNVPE